MPLANGRPAGESDEDDPYDDFGHGNFEPPGTLEVHHKRPKPKNADLWSGTFSEYPCAGTGDPKLSRGWLRHLVELGLVEDLRKFFSSPTVDKKTKELLLNNAFQGVDGSRLVVVAAQKGHVEVFQLLVDEGADLGEDKSDGTTLLMSLCSAPAEFRDKGGFEKRLVSCANVLFRKCEDVKGIVDSAQNRNATALMLAAKNGYADLVELLIGKGADLDLTDTQRWTALCFAVDKNHGHVARSLLEAGASVDVVTSDGQLLSDLVPPKSHKLLEIVESFSRRRRSLIHGDLGKERDEDGRFGDCKKFTELESLLLGIDAMEYLPAFERHKLSLEQFLCSSEAELEEIGVEKVGVRKKMMDAIFEIHKRDWEPSSLPQITPKDKQNGMYFACPDAVLIVANANKHVKLLKSCVSSLRKHIKRRPEQLRIGQEVAHVGVLAHHVKDARRSLAEMSSELATFDKQLSAFTRNPSYYPCDLVEARETDTKWKNMKAAAIGIAGIIALSAPFVIMTRVRVG